MIDHVLLQALLNEGLEDIDRSIRYEIGLLRELASFSKCHFVKEIKELGLPEGCNKADGHDKMYSSASSRNGKAVGVLGT